MVQDFWRSVYNYAQLFPHLQVGIFFNCIKFEYAKSKLIVIDLVFACPVKLFHNIMLVTLVNVSEVFIVVSEQLSIIMHMKVFMNKLNCILT